jgi:hypothetical protein
MRHGRYLVWVAGLLTVGAIVALTAVYQGFHEPEDFKSHLIDWNNKMSIVGGTTDKEGEEERRRQQQNRGQSENTPSGVFENLKDPVQLGKTPSSKIRVSNALSDFIA